mgnify:CR=1 FL=1
MGNPRFFLWFFRFRRWIPAVRRVAGGDMRSIAEIFVIKKSPKIPKNCRFWRFWPIFGDFEFESSGNAAKMAKFTWFHSVARFGCGFSRKSPILVFLTDFWQKTHLNYLVTLFQQSIKYTEKELSLAVSQKLSKIKKFFKDIFCISWGT